MLGLFFAKCLINHWSQFCFSLHNICHLINKVFCVDLSFSRCFHFSLFTYTHTILSDSNNIDHRLRILCTATTTTTIPSTAATPITPIGIPNQHWTNSDHQPGARSEFRWKLQMGIWNRFVDNWTEWNLELEEIHIRFD